MNNNRHVFFVAAYGIDGECEGHGYWEYARLSKELVEILRSLLLRNGAIFTCQMEGVLKPISLQFTSADGAAIGTYFVGSSVCASVLMLSGRVPETDKEVAQMFAQSVRESSRAIVGNLSGTAFADIPFQLERPLFVIVPWPSESVTDDQIESVQKVSIHLAAAYFAQ